MVGEGLGGAWGWRSCLWCFVRPSGGLPFPTPPQPRGGCESRPPFPPAPPPQNAHVVFYIYHQNNTLRNRLFNNNNLTINSVNLRTTPFKSELNGVVQFGGDPDGDLRLAHLFRLFVGTPRQHVYSTLRRVEVLSSLTESALAILFNPMAGGLHLFSPPTRSPLLSLPCCCAACFTCIFISIPTRSFS